MTDLFKNDRTYQRIANHLARQIQEGIYKEGEPLPSERDLSRLLDVSRTSVREAVIALEVCGMLEVKTGSGMYVTKDASHILSGGADLSWLPDPELDAFLSPAEEVSPFSLLQARLLIEPEAAALAAVNMNETHLTKIKEAYIMNMQDNLAHSTNHVGDRLLHIRIAIASGNDAYEMIMRQLLGHKYGKLFSTLQKHYTPEDMTMRSQYEHFAIVMALESRDAHAAREAMKKHLTNVIDIFQRQSNQV